MKFQLVIGTALCLAVASAQCQDTNEVQQLKKQLQELQKRIEQLERQQQKEQPPPPPTPPIAPPAQAPETTPLAQRWSPEQPIRIGSAQNYINLSFDALVAAGWSTADDIERLETGGHDPKERGFTVQNLETVFEGKIDPYFRGQANVVLQIDSQGETTIEAEEAY